MLQSPHPTLTVAAETALGDRWLKPGINAVRYYAQLIRNTEFSGPRECTSADATINRLPVGVVAAIVPWNVSFIAAMSKIPAALAAGCTVIHKPSPETPWKPMSQHRCILTAF